MLADKLPMIHPLYTKKEEAQARKTPSLIEKEGVLEVELISFPSLPSLPSSLLP